MSILSRSLCLCTLVLLATLTPANPLIAQSADVETTTNRTNLIAAGADVSYPPDPPQDILWPNVAGWADVVAAYNSARLQENALLGLTLPPFDFPEAAVWAALTSAEKALWLVNAERTARGVPPLQGLETNINTVAQDYAEWMLANNVFGHETDGRSPWDRIAANPAIGTCYDSLGIAESLYYGATTGEEPIPFVVEQALFKMIYEDAGSQWGHRHTILWSSYQENSGAPEEEGFLGIGHAHGGFTTPNTGRYFQNADIIVMNFFDPCPTWGEATTTTPQPTPTVEPTVAVEPTPTATATPSPTASPEPTATAAPDERQPSRSVSGRVTLRATPGNPGQGGTALAGVTITSDDGQSTQTDANGLFTLGGLSAGEHMLTATMEDYAFSPRTVEVDLSANNQTGIAFTASPGPTGTAFDYSLHLPLILPQS